MACLECSPTHQLSHRRERMESYLHAFVESVFAPLIPRRLERLVQRVLIGNLLTLMRRLHILKEQPLLPTFNIHQRTRVIAAAAERRGWRMTVLTIGGLATNIFRLHTGVRTLTFEGLPGLDPATTSTSIDNKEEARRLCQSLGLPTPRGKAFASPRRALAYGASLGFPLVVKPQYGSLSAHTTVDIRSEKELDHAIRSAREVSRSFIVEEYISGSLYRGTTVGGTLVACGRRDPPMIIGNGRATVEELVALRDAERRTLLAALGYSPDHIPSLPLNHMRIQPSVVVPRDERVAITWKINLAYGATVTDVTDEIHLDNRHLFETIARAVDLPCIGIDFIAPSIAVSWKMQRCAIIELNSLPSIDLHHPPIIQGRERDVAGALLDHVLHSQNM